MVRVGKRTVFWGGFFLGWLVFFGAPNKQMLLWVLGRHFYVISVFFMLFKGLFFKC